MRLPLGDADEQALDSAQLFRHAKAEDKRLIKELFGGPCFEGTLQKLLFLRLLGCGNQASE